MTDKPIMPAIGKHMKAFLDSLTDAEVMVVLRYIEAQKKDRLELLYLSKEEHHDTRSSKDH